MTLHDYRELIADARDAGLDELRWAPAAAVRDAAAAAMRAAGDVRVGR